MAQAKSANSVLAQRYAKALLDYAIEKAYGAKKLQEISAQLAVLAELSISCPQLTQIDKIAGGVDEAAKIIKEISKKLQLDDVVGRFLNVLSQNRRLVLLENLAETYAELLRAHNGDLNVHVVSAKPLSAAVKNALLASLKNQVAGNVNLQEQVDEALLGGLVVRIGSRMVDASVKGRLERLQQALEAA